ncbi:uncharacterized protein F4822DRAFT_423464 [Hypoxylon trugodes]|uniref:uncharacterized protein n=1 Tax=Hypoxylon trugodes TaxID=326681 RepID=UPI00219D7005|nr:uncharacterized protein F4822DRAFT_423464 [Hypoxylon trugodes]KAI1382583.1 hypothetical protein F4822DRAFT_423464 [Hypoxylon trugodes]
MGPQKGTRIDNFSGSKDRYIEYLEANVYDLREELKKLRPKSTSAASRGLELQHGLLTSVFETPKAQVPEQKPPWKTALLPLIERIPTTEAGWRQRRETLQMVTEADVIASIKCLTRSSSPYMPHENNETSEHSMTSIAIVKNYRNYTAILNQHRERSTQIFHFGTLLYICCCIVALETGADKYAVEEDMRAFLSSKAGSAYLREVRRGALWVIQRIKELVSSGLEHRAWELFFLCGMHIHAYQKCVHHRDSSDFTRLVPICSPPEEVQARIPFNIPILVWKISRGQWSIEVVNTALGTEVSISEVDAWDAAFSAYEIERPTMGRPSKRRRIEKTTSEITADGCEEQDMALDGNEATDGNQGLHISVDAAEMHSQDARTQVIRDSTHPPATEYSPDSISRRSFMNPSFMDDLHHWNLGGDDFVATGYDCYFIEIAPNIHELIHSAQKFTIDHIPRVTANVDHILSYGARLDVDQHGPIAKARIFELQWPSVLDRKMDEAIKSLVCSSPTYGNARAN